MTTIKQNDASRAPVERTVRLKPNMKARIEKKLSKRLVQKAPKMFKNAWKDKGGHIYCVGVGVEHWVKRAEWFSKIMLGWCCHTWFMLKSEPLKLTPLESWALSWAGFYAFDIGFKDWLMRTHNAGLTGSVLKR